MNANERVVVTGLGVVSALGIGCGEHFTALHAGASGFSSLSEAESATLGIEGWAPVRAFNRRSAVRKRMLRKVLRPAATFSLLAAREALAQAGLEGDERRLDDAGLFVGAISVDPAGAELLDAAAASIDAHGVFDISLFARRGIRHVDPFLIVKGLPNAGLCAISIEHGIHGPNLNLSNGVSSGLQAISAAFHAVRRGAASIAIAGGYDSQRVVDLIETYRHRGVLSTTLASDAVAARPFATKRDGFAVGEGAAFCVLEQEASARARGAPICAIIEDTRQASCHASQDEMHHRSLASLLKSFGDNTPAALFASGIGTPTADAREAGAVQMAWKAPPLLSSCTGAIGFTGAAASAFSFVHACHALRSGILAPSVGSADVDPALDVRVVLARTKLGPGRVVICEGSGSNKIALALRAP